MSFDPERATEHVLRLMREAGFRVSVFHNPGSLLGTVLPFVEVHAVVDDATPPDVKILRLYKHEHDFPEYTAVCRIAEQCGFDLE